MDADRAIGRRHFPIVIGRQAGAGLCGMPLPAACLSIVAGVVPGILPVSALLALVAAVPAAKAFRGAREPADDIPALIPSMGINVALNLAAAGPGLFIAWRRTPNGGRRRG